MNLNDDILSEYKVNRKSYNEKLDYFTEKLNEVEHLVDDLMFESKDSDIDISEVELAKIPNEEIVGIDVKTKELKELVIDTKKIMKSIKKLEGQRRAYNRSKGS